MRRRGGEGTIFPMLAASSTYVPPISLMCCHCREEQALFQLPGACSIAFRMFYLGGTALPASQSLDYNTCSFLLFTYGGYAYVEPRAQSRPSGVPKYNFVRLNQISPTCSAPSQSPCTLPGYFCTDCSRKYIVVETMCCTCVVDL